VTFRAGGEGSGKFCRTCAVECEALEVALEIVEERSFFAQLPGVFSYPFKKNGLTLMIIGTLIFSFMWWLSRFSLTVFVITAGYFTSYMQKILVYSGQGEEELPGWPEFSQFWSDIMEPFLLFAGTVVICIGPALACLLFGSDSVKMAFLPLIALGGFYFPMALLAVAMKDTPLAVNPLVVLPAIFKAPLEYIVTVILMGIILALDHSGDPLIHAIFRRGLYTHNMAKMFGFLGAKSFWLFFQLYLLAVNMRILGLLYISKKRKFGWFEH